MRLPPRGGQIERKLVLGLTQPVYLQLSHLYLSVQCCLGDFFALVKNKDKPQGERGSLDSITSGCGNSVGIWPPCDILFRQVITASLRSFSSLRFLSPSSHHALPPLTLFPPTLARKEEGLTAVCQAAFAAVPRGAGGQRLGTSPGVNPEDGGWVRLLPKHRSLWEGRPPLAPLLAVGQGSGSVGFTLGLGTGVGWGGEYTSWTLSEGLILVPCRKCTGLMMTSKPLSKAAVKVSSSCSSPWAGVT